MKTQIETINSNDTTRETYIGVDAAKETLDAYRTHGKAMKQFPNSKEGFQQFLQWNKETPPTLVLCESTGGYEKNFVIADADADVPFRVVKCVKADNVFKQLYLRITKNRPHKAGIIAVAHEILIIAHALVKNNVRWKNLLLEKCP